MAEKVFGFVGTVAETKVDDSEHRRINALALGNSLLVCMAVPWVLCLLFYTGTR